MALDDLNPRQQLYLKGLAQGKTKKQAALDAGYSEQTADNAKHVIEGDSVRREFQRLIRSKVSAEKLAQRIAEGLDAEETKFFQKDGYVCDERNVVAWGERRAYAELAAEYGGYFIPKQELDVNGTNDGGSRLAQLLSTATARVNRPTESSGEGGS